MGGRQSNLNWVQFTEFGKLTALHQSISWDETNSRNREDALVRTVSKWRCVWVNEDVSDVDTSRNPQTREKLSSPVFSTIEQLTVSTFCEIALLQGANWEQSIGMNRSRDLENHYCTKPAHFQSKRFLAGRLTSKDIQAIKVRVISMWCSEQLGFQTRTWLSELLFGQPQETWP